MSFCTEMQMDHMIEDPEDPLLRSFRYLITGSVTDTIPHGCQLSGWTRLIWRGMLLRRLTYWKAAGTIGRHLGTIDRTSTNASPACSATMVSRTPPTA